MDCVVEFIKCLPVPPTPSVNTGKSKDVQNSKHLLNVELCGIAGKLVASGFDPAAVCKAKRILLARISSHTHTSCGLTELFIQECHYYQEQSSIKQ
jgi:hypothetical protein